MAKLPVATCETDPRASDGGHASQGDPPLLAPGGQGRRRPEVARVIENSFAASARDAGEARAYLEQVRAEYLRQYEQAIRA